MTDQNDTTLSLPKDYDEMVVWKFPIEVKADNVLDMPKGARILTVAVQRDTPFMWALCDPMADKVKRHIRIAGTGHPISRAESHNHVCTFQMMNGGLIWHVFDCGEYVDAGDNVYAREETGAPTE